MSKKKGEKKSEDISSKGYLVAFCVEEDREKFIGAVDAKRVEEQKKLNPEPLVFDGVLTVKSNKNDKNNKNDNENDNENNKINIVLYNQEGKSNSLIPTFNIFKSKIQSK